MYSRPSEEGRTDESDTSTATSCREDVYQVLPIAVQITTEPTVGNRIAQREDSQVCPRRNGAGVWIRERSDVGAVLLVAGHEAQGQDADETRCLTHCENLSSMTDMYHENQWERESGHLNIQ